MSAVDCKRPSPHDALELCDLFARILRDNFPMFPSEARADYARPWSPAAISSRLERSGDLLLAAYVNGRIIGIASGPAPEAGVGTIVWLVIDREAQGRAIGEALFRSACDVFAKLDAHKVKLTAPSERARRFYERCGMTLEGVHVDHWYRIDFFSLGMSLVRQ